MYKVMFSRKAINNATIIFKTTIDFNPEFAEKLKKEFVDLVNKLSYFPNRFPKKFKNSSIRKVIIQKRYIVYFSIDDNRVYIANIIDGMTNK